MKKSLCILIAPPSSLIPPSSPDSDRNPHARWKLLPSMHGDLRRDVVVCSRRSEIRKVDIGNLEPDGMPGAKYPVVSKVSEGHVTHFTRRETGNSHHTHRHF